MGHPCQNQASTRKHQQAAQTLVSFVRSQGGPARLSTSNQHGHQRCVSLGRLGRPKLPRGGSSSKSITLSQARKPWDRTMVPDALEFSTKELSKETLPDFERLFEKRPAPGAFICWCLYYQRARPPAVGKGPTSRAREAAGNRQEKRELVGKGRSHGILVYSKGEPVGWCQYGSREELPRIDNNPRYRKLVPEGNAKRLWRITCFTVDRKYRRRGVASFALKAALEAIRSKGGGLVEAYPITGWGAYSEYLGTVSMFRKQGFTTVAPFGKNNAVMRRAI